MVLGRWKSRDRKIVSLSLYVEKPLNSKVIKSFVPELRSRKCFSCFGIPMLYMCVMDILNVLRTGMNMSISRIHVWLCNTSFWSNFCHRHYYYYYHLIDVASVLSHFSGYHS